MSDPDYIVLRHDPRLHPSAWVPLLEGRWYDLAGRGFATVRVPLLGGTAEAGPTGRFEVNEAGSVAEVWEIRVDE